MMGLDYALRRRGPMTMAPSQLGMFAKSSPDYATANIEFHVQPLSLDRFGEPLHDFPGDNNERLQLEPDQPRFGPCLQCLTRAPRRVIQPDYLTTFDDRRVAADSIRLARRLAGAPALARYAPRELKPGARFQDEDELAERGGRHRHDDLPSRRHRQDGFRADDPAAVVDERLKVFGLGGLRVVDASVMPRITSRATPIRRR